MDGKQEKGRDDRRVRRTKQLLRGALLGDDTASAVSKALGLDEAQQRYVKELISIEYLDGNKDLPYIITLIVVGVIAVAAISVISVILIRNKKKRDEFYKI